MSYVAWGMVAGGAVLAAVAAVADGAVLAESSLLSTAPADAVIPPPVRARAVPSRERTHRALAAARILGHLVCGAGIAGVVHIAEGPTLAPLLLLVGLLMATVVLAETSARVLGDSWGDAAASRLRPFITWVDGALSPVVRVGDWVDGLFADGVIDPDATQERRDEAAAQFRDVIAGEATVSRDERELLLGVFDFGETTAEEVMVPRVDILGIECNTPWSEMLDRVRSAQHSRVPVYEDTIDEIVGILYVKDVLAAALSDTEPADGWRSLMRPPVFIPASKRIADLLKEFRQARRHIAIVADEYGGTAGLVTIEDVLEELVGEIRDEYDDEERSVESEGGQRYWVSGQLTLDDLSDALGYAFERDDVSTIGGLIFELLGRVPRAGEALTIGPFRVIVERVIRRKIARVFLERMDLPPSRATAGSDAE